MNTKRHSSSINEPYFFSRISFVFEIRWHTAIIAIVSLISLVAITFAVGPDEKLNAFFYLIPLIVAVVLKGIRIPPFDERVNRFAVTVFAVICILLFLFTVLLSQGILRLCVGEPSFLIWYASATIIAFSAADTINSDSPRRASIDEVNLSALLILFALQRMALKPEFAIALMLLSLEPWLTGRIRGTPMYIGLARSLAAIQFMGQSFQQ
jgi:hypothetical protein